jgi:hypothetical protein
MTVVRAETREDWIPPIDSEVFNEQMHLNALSDILAQDVKHDLFKKITNKSTAGAEAMEYLVFGMSKGSVYFVNT